jgi:hypothetical protein
MSRRCDLSMHSIEARLAAWWMLRPTHNPPRTPSARRTNKHHIRTLFIPLCRLHRNLSVPLPATGRRAFQLAPITLPLPYQYPTPPHLWVDCLKPS